MPLLLPAAAHALFLLADLAQTPLVPRPLHRVELALEAAPQIVGFATQSEAPLARFLPIATLAITGLPIAALLVTRPRPGPAATVIALQIAIVVADIADAAAHIRQRGSLLAAISAAAGCDERIAAQRCTRAAAQVRALRQALRRGRLPPGDPAQQQPG